MEYLCDSLCYQLDLASFVACVNSGHSWNSKLSLTLSGKDQIAYNGEDAQLDPFVENFVLERLSAQSPLRVSHHYNPLVISLLFFDMKIVILNLIKMDDKMSSKPRPPIMLHKIRLQSAQNSVQRMK